MRLFVCIVLVLASFASAQDVQVSPANKTIAVTAEDAVEVEAEVAVLLVGFQNRAATKDAAYRENLANSDRILKALLDAGVPKANIETSRLDLHERERDEPRRQPVEFEAQQSWTLHVAASIAQSIVDVAVRAGANIVRDVEWTVANPVALEARAGGAALAKARAIAEQMAQGLGAKLGALIYASNRAPVARMFRSMQTLQTSSAMAMVVADKLPEPKLTLLPSLVRKQATVHAVFAIE